MPIDAQGTLADATVVTSAPSKGAARTVPAEQVERALALLRAAVLRKIRNAWLEPRWLGPTRFWCKSETRDGWTFIAADAETGAREPLFDHERVAEAIAGTLTADPRRLPLAGVRLRPDGLELRFRGAPAPFLVADGRIAPAPDPDAPPGALASPDGRSAVFVRDQALWIRDLASGADRPLTEAGEEACGFAVATAQFHFRVLPQRRSGVQPPPSLTRWSPDSRLVFAAHTDERHVRPYPIIENAPADGAARPRVHWIRVALLGERQADITFHLIDVKTGERLAVRTPDGELRLAPTELLRVFWSETCDRLYLLVRDEAISTLSLYEVDAATGEARVVVADRSMAGQAFGPGAPPPAVALVPGSRQAVWMSAADASRHLFVLDLKTGERVRQLTGGDWLVREILAVDASRGFVVFTASGREVASPYHVHIYRVGLDGEGLVRLTDDDLHHIVLPAGEGPPGEAAVTSPGGRFVFHIASTVAEPGETRLLDVTSGRSTVVEAVDAADLLASGYRPPAEFAAPAAEGGQLLHGLVYRPSDYDPTRRYPVVLMQYGSPLVAITPRAFTQAAANVIGFTNCAAMAELGFVVAVVDARGTPGRIDDFSRQSPGYLRHMGLPDQIAFLRALAASDPAVDLDRVGVSGISFGGWTTFRAMIEYPDMFKAGVSGAAPGDFATMWRAPTLTRCHADPGDLTGDDLRALLADLDTARSAERVRGRLLIVAGEQDENVYLSSTLRFYDALLNADKDVELILVPNAGHGGIYLPAIIRRECAFFLEHLADMRLPEGVRFASPVPEA